MLRFPFISSLWCLIFLQSSAFLVIPFNRYRTQTGAFRDNSVNSLKPTGLYMSTESSTILASFNKMSLSDSDLISIVQSWSDEMAIENDKDIIRFSRSPSGSLITFSSSPGSSLDLAVEDGPEASQAVSIQSRMVLGTENTKSHSLVQFSSQNLMDSLLMYIGEKILERSQLSKVSPSIPTKAIEVELPFALPTEESILGLWKTSDRVPERVADAPPTHVADLTLRDIKVWFGVDHTALPKVVGYLTGWATKYTSRGIGIQSEEAVDGVTFRFASFPNEEYIVTASYDEIVSSLAIRGRRVASSADGAEENDVLMRTAVDNLSTAIEKAMGALLLTDDIDSIEKQKQERQHQQNDKPVQQRLPGDFSAAREEAKNFQPQQQTPPFANLKDFERATQAAQAQRDASSNTKRQRDPELADRARELGLNLDKFEGKGIEEQAMKELRDLVENSKAKGFLSVLKSNTTGVNSATEVEGLFRAGSEISSKSWEELLARPSPYMQEDLSKLPTTLPINLAQAGLEKGIDIFEGPPAYDVAAVPASSIQGQQLTSNGGDYSHIVKANPAELERDQKRMSLLLQDLARAEEGMHELILDSYRDLLLSGSFLRIMRGLDETAADDVTRMLCAKIVKKASLLTAELGTLIKTESVRHLQTIHDICDVAANYQNDELQFLDRMEMLKPRFDTTLLSYLKFAVAEEEVSLRLSGKDPRTMPSSWLQVLRIVSQGVFAELESRFERLLEPLLLVVRFSDPDLQADIFQRFVNITASLDLPYLRELALNMIASTEVDPDDLEDAIKTNVLNLRSCVELYLSEDFINEKLEALKNKANEEGKKMVIRQRSTADLSDDELSLFEAAAKDANSNQNTPGLPLFDKAVKPTYPPLLESDEEKKTGGFDELGRFIGWG